MEGAIPPELGQLSNLTALWLNGNELEGAIPPELGQLSSLTELWLNGNQLTGTIPAELGQLTNLTHLSLDRNRLTGELPRELQELRLEFLALDPSLAGLSLSSGSVWRESLLNAPRRAMPRLLK